MQVPVLGLQLEHFLLCHFSSGKHGQRTLSSSDVLRKHKQTVSFSAGMSSINDWQLKSFLQRHEAKRSWNMLFFFVSLFLRLESVSVFFSPSIARLNAPSYIRRINEFKVQAKTKGTGGFLRNNS